MHKDALAWKNKYLELLNKQEKLDARFNTQTELLKRALIRSSMAAEGNDELLDQKLQNLRLLLRNNIDNDELEYLIEQLEQAVLESEKNLLQHKQSLHASFTYFVQQLLHLQPAKETQHALHAFEKGLPKQLAQPYNLHKVLGQLKELQECVLAATQLNAAPALSTPELLARLFKGTTSSAQSSSELSTEKGLKGDTSTTLEEVSYASVAEHIQQTLSSLLTNLPVIQNHQQQISGLRTRVDQGLNCYELAALLDELSAIFLAIAHGNENQLEQYLLQLNQRLALFHENLQTTSNEYNSSAKDAQELGDDLRQHVSSFKHDLHMSTDLDELKKRVDIRLNRFIDTLQVYQEKREHCDSAIIQRFQDLSEHSEQMEQEALRLSEKLEEQRKKALLDPLTGLANRASLNERLELEYARVQRNNGSLLQSIIDIDNFKRINDSYGHLAGDKVLKTIASELKKRLRKTDFIARFGGEEYVILLPDTPLQKGYEVIDSLRVAIEASPFHFRGEPVTITFSAGIGQVTAEESLEQAFERIDQALYAAKKSGRNTVRMSV